MTSQPPPAAAFITPQALLEHWQGHRRLTRRVIDAFPAEALFTFSIGGMRTFGEMALEMLTMATPMVTGILTGAWETTADRSTRPKADVLREWDAATVELDRLWPQIPPARFMETMTAFGQYPGTGHALVLYVIDNEIHHRGQGTVYLRALGIEPPAFYER
jgi:uncharacterized damage-inducible protein DinB